MDSTPVILYVVNADVERIGTDSDADIIKRMISRGYAVAVCDYLNSAAAVSPALDWSAQTVRNQLKTGAYFTDKAVFPEGTYYNSFVVPAGYDLSFGHVFWEIDKHATDGTLEKIVEIWNNDFRGVKAEMLVKWTDAEGNRKATQSGHDGTEPVWLDANGTENAEGEYVKVKHTLATDIRDCVKKDGTPIDLNLYMHLIYPTGGVEVPVMTLVGSAEHLANGAATADRPQLVGAVLKGYAGVMYDHGYTPMARDDHYGYFDGNATAGHVTGENTTYSVQFYNSVQIHTAAMRYIRYLSLSEEQFAFKLDGIGAYGNSKGGWMAFLGEEDPYAYNTQKYYPNHHGETRYENGDTADKDIIDGGEPQPWLTYGGDEIEAGADFIYCSCGGATDGITAGHAPTFITCNIADGSYYTTSNEFVNVCRNTDVPTMWFEVNLGHTFGYGKDTKYGADVYDAFFTFADYWLKGEAVEVVYINADMTYGGMPTYAPFTVKFSGSVSEEEIAKVTLTDPLGNAVAGYWTQGFGRTEWTYHPEALQGNTAYTMTVPAELKGENGLELGKDVVYSITTGLEMADGVTRVEGTAGTYFYFTMPDRTAVTEFDVNKYLLRLNVTNDAVNTLGIYEVTGFDPASPDASFLGAKLLTIPVNGRGYYEADLTSQLSGKAAGESCAFLVKSEKATGETTVFNCTMDGALTSGLSVSNTVNNYLTTFEGDGVLALDSYALSTIYTNNHFYGNFRPITIMANSAVVGGANLTASDSGRRFNISFRVYDTVERTLNVFLSNCTSESGGIADYGAYEFNVRTRAGEWVDVSFTYDVYEPEMFGEAGLAKKILYIKSHAFGTEAPVIYFDDFKTVELVSEVTLSEAELVLTTTEQRKNPLETEYGTIPEQYADVNDYPFVVFNSQGKFITATDVWATDGGDGAMGACAKQSNVDYVILLRRNYSYTDATSFNNFAFVYGKVLLDLGTNTMSLEETHSNSLFYCHAKRSDATTVNIKNGTILLGKNPLIKIGAWNTPNYKFETLVKDFNFNLEGVTLGLRAGATATSIVENTAADAPVNLNVNLTDCTVDLKTNAPASAPTLFKLGDADGFITAKVNVEGGLITGGDLASCTLFAKNNSASSFTLTQNAEGEYLKQRVNTGAGVIAYSTSIDGVTHTYKKTDAGEGYDEYTLEESALDTPYGAIGAAYSDASAYPFAIFKKSGDGYVFVTAIANAFADSSVTAYRDINADIVIYMRSDFTATSRFTNLCQCYKGVTFDLGEHTLTANGGSQTLYVLANTMRHTESTSLYYNFKNGTIITDKAKAFVLIGSNNTGGNGIDYSVTFDNVKFERPDTATNAHPIVEFTNSQSTFNTDITTVILI